MRTAGRTLLSNSAWSLSNQIARVATLAIVTIALSRHFGPQRFGSLAVGLAFVRIFAVIAAFGLDRVLVRRLVEAGEEASSTILRSAFRLKLGITLLSYVALVAIVFLIDPHDRLTLAIVVLAGAGLVFQPFDVFDYAFQAQSRFRLTFVGRTLPLLVCTGIKVGAIVAGAPLVAFAALETFEAGLVAVTLFLVYRPVGGPGFAPRKLPLTIDWRQLLGDGFPLLLGSLAVMIYIRCDVLMVGKIAGYKAAGIYSAAAQICEACALLPMAFVPALFPLLVRWRKCGAHFYRRQFERLFLAAVLIGLSISLTLTLAARPIVALLYGHEYLPAANLLLIQSWATAFVFIGIVQSGYDLTEGLTWLATLRTGTGALINVLLNFFLIPRFGASGAAAATVIAQACSSVLLNSVAAQTRPIFLMQLKALLLVPALRSVFAEISRSPASNWSAIRNGVKLADG